MGICNELQQEAWERCMEPYWEEIFGRRQGKPISDEDYQDTYFASYEAYREEVADRAVGISTRGSVVPAKIARVLEIRQARQIRRARIAELRAKFPNRSTL